MTDILTCYLRTVWSAEFRHRRRYINQYGTLVEWCGNRKPEAVLLVKKTIPKSHFALPNSHWTETGSNQGLRRGIPATNRQNVCHFWSPLQECPQQWSNVRTSLGDCTIDFNANLLCPPWEANWGSASQNICTFCGTWKLLNPLNTKRRLLYLKAQFVPRSKHFSSRL